MDNVRYYLSVFLRRLHWFLIVATGLSAIAITMALTLPPAYVSQTRLVVESAQIPEELAASTVRTPALEQLQIIEQRLLTRANLLDIARELNVLPNLQQMNADEIVAAMRARTTLRTISGRDQATLMTLSFEARHPRIAANVLNAYLTLIQEEDAEFRRGRAEETLEFFRQEVDRLGIEIERQSAAIIEFKQANADALPDSLDFRMNQQATLQERRAVLQREIAALAEQRRRVLALFEQTGTVTPVAGTPVPVDPDRERLAELRRQLEDVLVIFAPENPRVRVLEARIAQLEAKIAAAAPETDVASTDETPVPTDGPPSALDIQLAEIDGRSDVLTEQLAELDDRLAALEATITRTPGITITLEELEREFETLQAQFQRASDRLAQAETGQRIETNSRGQRISVIEQPAVPSEPTKPNRMRIAGGGVVLGIGAGIGLIFLLELLNSTARRPEDLVKRFGITPLTTVPYVRTRGQKFRQRSVKVALLLAILTIIPAAIYAVHVYYLPLDLLADKVMNRLGVRW